MSNASAIAKEVRIAVLREEHNAFAEVESFCTGTVVKLERYAPLLQYLAKRKERIRRKIAALDVRHAGRKS